MKKSIFTLAIVALTAVSASAHPAFNPFRHLGGNKTVAVANSEKTVATAHPGKTVALENEGILKNLSNNGGRKAVAYADNQNFGGADGDWLPDGNFPPSLGG